jgi:hypothetical protein
MPKSGGRATRKRSRGPTPPNKTNRVVQFALGAVNDTGDEKALKARQKSLVDALTEQLGDTLRGSVKTRFVLALEAKDKLSRFPGLDRKQVKALTNFLEENPTGALVIAYAESEGP